MPLGVELGPAFFKLRATGGQRCHPGRDFALLGLECPVGCLNLGTRLFELSLSTLQVGLFLRRFFLLLDQHPTLGVNHLPGRFQFPRLLLHTGFGSGQLLPIRSEGRPLGLESALCGFDRLPQRGELALIVGVGGLRGLEFCLPFCHRGRSRLVRIPIGRELAASRREVVLILCQSRLACFQGRPLGVELAACRVNLGALGIHRGAIGFDLLAIRVDLGAGGLDRGALRFEVVTLRFDFRALGPMFGTLALQGGALRVELAARRFDLLALGFRPRTIGFQLFTLRVDFGTPQEQFGASRFEPRLLLFDLRTLGLDFAPGGFEGLAVRVDLPAIRLEFGAIRGELGALGCELGPLGLQRRSIGVDFGPFAIELGALRGRTPGEFVDFALAIGQSLRVVCQPPRVRGLRGFFLLERGSIRFQRCPVSTECLAGVSQSALQVGESFVLGSAVAAHAFDGRLLRLEIGSQRDQRSLLRLVLIAQMREPGFGDLQRLVTLIVLLSLGIQRLALPRNLRSLVLKSSLSRFDFCLSRLQDRSLRFELGRIGCELAS